MSESFKLSTIRSRALINGEDPVEAKKRAELRSRISKEAEKYIETPVTSWPVINFNWDVSVISQRFSLDGFTKNDFQKQYPMLTRHPC
jgi:hypothetical protein